MLYRILLLAFAACLLTGCGTGVDIWKAVDAEDLPAIRLYKERGGNLNFHKFNSYVTPLMYAMERSRKKSYQHLLDLGANPNFLSRNKISILHLAAQKSDSFWLEAALKAGGNPNLFNEHARLSARGTVLWYASVAGKTENVRFLLDAGAQIDAYAHLDHTAFVDALYYRHFDTALLLLERGANIYIKSSRGNGGADVIMSRLLLARGPHPSFNAEETDKIRKMCEILKERGFDAEKAEWDVSTQSWTQKK